MTNVTQSLDVVGAVPISFVGVLIAAIPLLAVAAIGAHLRLGLNRELAIGAVRCVAQLSAVGYVLVPIFHANRWFITVPYLLAMCSVAAVEAVSRPKHAYPGMLPQVFFAMGISSTALITFALCVVIPTRPAFDSRYIIPMLGMLLGSACSSVAVGLSAALEELSMGAKKVEALLAMGASRSEATRHVVRRSVRLALIQLVNALNVTGLVVIPGMMTGQILGGSDPVVAARYQIVIFFLLAASTALSVTATVYAAVYAVVGSNHTLQANRITPKQPAGDILARAGELAGRAMSRASAALLSGRMSWNGGSGGHPADLDEARRERKTEGPTPLHPRAVSSAAQGVAAAEAVDPQHPFTLTVENLVRHLGSRLLHDNIGFTVRSGETLFVTGPSGCGKTKLLRSLAALEDPDAGSVRLNGQGPADVGRPAWRSKVGYGFQQGVPFGDIPDAGTPAQLFAATQRFHAQRARSHLRLAETAEKMDLEEGLLHRDWKDLSGGEAQRAQLAILVALQPAVLLLDEPTSALDTAAAIRVESVLKASGAALVWVSHDVNQPRRVGGRVLKLPEGTVT